MIQELAGLKINGRIKAPIPFTGEATIVGFRYYTGRHTGRTSMVADYITDDGKASFDPIEKLVPLKIEPGELEPTRKGGAEVYVYIQSEKPNKDNNYRALYTVGFYEPYAMDRAPRFIAESDHANKERAAARVSYLNGGKDDTIA